MGPLYYYELVRLARKGRGTLLRCAYVAAGLVALYFVYHGRFPSHDLWDEPFSPGVTSGTRDLASLARDFVTAVLWVQTVAVVVLTPAYLAGAIADERERGTLDLLLTTQLSDREIVLGKLAARVTHPGGILLAGLPLLAATQLWGGVDFRTLLGAFALTGLNLLTVASICMLYSVLMPTAWAAINSSYVTALALSVCCFCLALPAGTPIYLFGVVPAGGSRYIAYLQFWCAGDGQAAVVLLCLTAAVFLLRSHTTSPATARPARDAGTTALKKEQSGDKEETVPERPRREMPSVGDRPLLWLEVYRFQDSRRAGWAAWTVYLVVTGASAGLFACIRLLDRQGGAAGAVATALRLGLVGLAACWCAATGFLAAGGIGRERDRRTLDALLTLPCSRSAVLGAKWVGSILRTADAGALAGTVGLIALLTGSLHPLAVPLLVIAVAGQLCFWASLGVWLSTAFRSTLRTRIALALAVLLVFGASWFLAEGDPLFDRSGHSGDPATTYGSDPLTGAVRAYTANPIRCFWLMTFTWWGAESPNATESREAPLFGVRLVAACGGTLEFALAAGMLWLAACRRFRKE